MILHGSQLFFIECDYPIEWGYWAIWYVLLILGLFVNFYIQEYIVRRKKRLEAQQKPKKDQ
jgi:hypothetical protein